MIPIPKRTYLAVAAIFLFACNLTDRPGLDSDPSLKNDTTKTTSGTGGPRVNHAPTLGLGVHNVSMLEGESKVLVLKARDEDGDPIAFTIPNLDSLRALFPDGKKAITVATGGDSLRLVFVPGSSKGNYRFRIVVSDTAGGVEEQLLTISVGKVNRPPSVGFAAPASGTAFRAREGKALEFTVSATDPDGDKVTLLSLSNPPWPRYGSGGYDTRSGKVTFTPSFQAVSAGETTFADLVFKAQDDGSPAETGQIAARITVIDSNSAPRWSTKALALAGKEGQPMVLELKPLYGGDDEKDQVAFTASCGGIDAGSLRWTFTPGFRDAGKRECALTATDSHRPPAASALTLSLDIADSVRAVDVAILSPVSGAIVKDSVVAVEWMIGDQKQTVETTERLATEGPNVIRRSFLDSLGNFGSDSVTVIRDTEAPLAPVISVPGILNIAFPRWSWHGGGGGDGHYRVRLDDPDPAAPMTEWGDTIFAPSAPLPEGRHELFVQERDAAGNWSPAASAAVTLDLTPPVVKILSPASGSWTNASILDVQWTLDGVPQAAQTTEALSADGVLRITRFAFDEAGNRGADSILVLRRSAAGAAPILSGTPSPTRAPEWTWTTGGPGGTGAYRIGWANGAWFDTLSATRYAPPADLPEGPRTLFVSESDSAGNWSAPASLTLVVDRTPPILQITGPGPQAAITSVDPALTGTLEEASGAATVRWSGQGIPAGEAQVTGPYWTLPALAYPAGDVTVTLTPVDAAGNGGSPVSITIYKRPGVVFVRQGATGKGTSWQDAFGDVWQAAALRGSATEIWVADGAYATSANGTAALDVPSGVAIYGGFPSAGTGLSTADRSVADPKSALQCSGPAGGFAVRLLGDGSVLDGFRIEAAGGALQGDSGNSARNLIIANAGGPAPVEIVTGDHGKTFAMDRVRIEGSGQAAKAALTVRAKAKVTLTGCSITGNASAMGGGGGIWLDQEARLTAKDLTLTGNTVADTAGARPLQMHVEDRATADVQGTVEGDAAGIEVVKGGKAKLNGADVPAAPDPKPAPVPDSGAVAGP
jgi:hypothetical protein